MMKGISIKAVIIGTVVDLILSFAGGVVLAIAVAMYSMVLSGNTGHFNRAEFDRLFHSTPTLLLSTALGCGVSFIGGALTGWIAKSHRVKNAIVLAIVEIVISLPFLPFSAKYPAWYIVGGTIVGTASIILGGWISELVFGEFDRK